MDPEMPWVERSPNYPAEDSCRLIVHITRWNDFWVPCRDPKESPRPPLHLKKGTNMPLKTRKSREFHCFKCCRCLTIFYIVRNPNITVSNRKRELNSHLTSNSVRIVLPRRVYIPELSLIPRQVSWLHWTNSSFEWTSPPQLENIPQVAAATRENPWDFPLAARWGPIPLPCVQSNCVFPIKHIRSLDFLDWTPESPQQHSHKMRRTLLSPQECKIARCTQNQIEMRPISLALAP